MTDKLRETPKNNLTDAIQVMLDDFYHACENAKRGEEADPDIGEWIEDFIRNHEVAGVPLSELIEKREKEAALQRFLWDSKGGRFA